MILIKLLNNQSSCQCSETTQPWCNIPVMTSWLIYELDHCGSAINIGIILSRVEMEILLACFMSSCCGEQSLGTVQVTHRTFITRTCSLDCMRPLQKRCMMPWGDSVFVLRWPFPRIQKNFACPTSKLLHFSMQITYGLEDNKIPLA